jgi:FkbM family methyltransferase
VQLNASALCIDAFQLAFNVGSGRVSFSICTDWETEALADLPTILLMSFDILHLKKHFARRERLKDHLRKIWRRVKRVVRPPLHRPERHTAYRVLGTDYGGWPVIDGSLTAQSRVFSFGVGEDISFDLELIKRFGCEVDAFDPTPRSCAWIAGQDLPPGFRFHPVGLSDRTATLRFAAPANEEHVSFSIRGVEKAAEVIELPVQSLGELNMKAGAGRIDLLKMDIEGSEYDVVPDIADRGPRPSQLCIEFHHGMYGFTDDDTRRAVALLKAAGYVLFYVSETGREYGFSHFGGDT